MGNYSYTASFTRNREVPVTDRERVETAGNFILTFIRGCNRDSIKAGDYEGPYYGASITAVDMVLDTDKTGRVVLKADRELAELELNDLYWTLEILDSVDIGLPYSLLHFSGVWEMAHNGKTSTIHLFDNEGECDK